VLILLPNDDVEKVSSEHPAVNQMDYQDEVQVLARSGSPSMIYAFHKAAAEFCNRAN
jgi:hypothetical protein